MSTADRFTKRIPITIDSDNIGETLTDFPILINVTEATFFSDLSGDDTNKYKIAVTTDDGETECYVELAYYDFASNKCFIHTKIPTISSTVDTTVYLYWGLEADDNTTYVGVTGETAGQNVWDVNFAHVFHMDSPWATNPYPQSQSLTDPVIRGNFSPYSTAVMVDTPNGKGIDYELLDRGNLAKLSGEYSTVLDTSVTIEVYFAAESFRPSTGYNMIVDNYSGSFLSSYLCLRGGIPRFAFREDASTHTRVAGSTVVLGQYYYMGGSWTTTESFVAVLADEAPYISPLTYTGTFDKGSNDWQIGDWSTISNRSFDGIIDEARISFTKRSEHWMVATRANLKQDLLTFSIAEYSDGSPINPPDIRVPFIPPNNAGGAISFATGVVLGHGFFGHDNQIISTIPAPTPAMYFLDEWFSSKAYVTPYPGVSIIYDDQIEITADVWTGGGTISGMAVDTNKNLYFNNQNTRTIYKMVGESDNIDTSVGYPPPYDVDALPDKYYMSDLVYVNKGSVSDKLCYFIGAGNWSPAYLGYRGWWVETDPMTTTITYDLSLEFSWVDAIWTSPKFFGYDENQDWIVGLVNAWNSIGGYRGRIVRWDRETGNSIGTITSTPTPYSYGTRGWIDSDNQWLYIYGSVDNTLRWYDYTQVTATGALAPVDTLPGFLEDQEGIFGVTYYSVPVEPEPDPEGILDLTTFTSVDENNDFTITSAKLNFFGLRRDAVSYVYYDFGVDYFGDFEINFEIEITDITNDGSVALLSVTNTLGTHQDILDAAEGLIFWVYGSGAVSPSLQMKDKDHLFPATASEIYNPGGSSSPLVYCTFKRTGMDVTCDIYSDSDRETLLDGLTFNCTANKKRYLSVLMSRDSASDPSKDVSGYIQNVEIVSVDTTVQDTQNLQTFTEVDADGSLAVTADRVTFTALQRNLTSYVVYDFGADYFGEYEFDFELKVDDTDNQGNVLVCGISNTVGSFGDMQATNDILGIWMYGSSGNLRIYNSDFNLDNQLYYGDGGTSSNLLYITILRVSNIQKMVVYSDAARTTKISTKDITCETGTKRYFYALSSRDVGTYPTENATGYGQNYKIIYPI